MSDLSDARLEEWRLDFTGWKHFSGMYTAESAERSLALIAEVRTLRAKVEAAEAERDAEKARVRAVERETERWRNKADTAEAEVQRLRDEITALADEHRAKYEKARPKPGTWHSDFGYMNHLKFAEELDALLAAQVQDKPEADCQVCHFCGPSECKVHSKPEAGEPS